MDWKPFDPKRAPIIQGMFELMATGEWSLSDVTKWANEQGFTMVAQRRKRTEEEMMMDEDDEDAYFKNTPKIERPASQNGVQKILRNKFYIGLTHGNNGAWVESTAHKALVSRELFDDAGMALDKHRVSIHYANKIPHAYRGRVRCGDCGRVYTPYIRKGIHYLYSRCPKTCPNTARSIRATDLEDAIGDVIKKLAFTEDEKVEIDARTSTDIAVIENKRQSELDRIDRRKRKVREDIAYIGTNKLMLLRTGAYTPEALLEEEKKLSTELSNLQSQEIESDTSLSQVIQEAIKLSELLDDVAVVYEKGEPEDKEIIIRGIFSELIYTNNVLEYQAKNAFKALNDRFLPTCDHNTWLSELCKQRDFIALSIKELEKVLKI